MAVKTESEKRSYLDAKSGVGPMSISVSAGKQKDALPTAKKTSFTGRSVKTATVGS